MKAVIFAGGVGTRLWPLSRKKTPKQFEKMIEGKSTLQLTVENLLPEFSYKDIFIATGLEYIDIVKKQFPELPAENLFGEPSRRDVGPAVAYAMGYLSKHFPNEPIVVLWSDHLIQNKEKFKSILKSANSYLTNDPQKIIYLGHKPRFASENLGWIETGGTIKTVDSIGMKAFNGFRYRPDSELAKTYFEDSHFCWNLGSFASTPKFIYEMFKNFAPNVYNDIEDILSHRGKPDFESYFKKKYKNVEKIHMDTAVSEKIDPKYALVIVEDIGWSDVGAWEALKEALQNNEDDSVTHGKVILDDCRDSLLYNYEDGKTLVAIDLDDLLVVNRNDVLLVTRKSSVSKIKKLVESLDGTDNENLT